MLQRPDKCYAYSFFIVLLICTSDSTSSLRLKIRYALCIIIYIIKLYSDLLAETIEDILAAYSDCCLLVNTE